MDATVLEILPQPPNPTPLLNFFPNEEYFDFLKSRYNELKTRDGLLGVDECKNEDAEKTFGFFAKAFIFVFLGNEYLFRNQATEGQRFLNLFKNLIGKQAADTLNHAASPNSDPECSGGVIDEGSMNKGNNTRAFSKLPKDNREGNGAITSQLSQHEGIVTESKENNTNRRISVKASAKFLMANRYADKYEELIKECFKPKSSNKSGESKAASSQLTFEWTHEHSCTLQFITLHYIVGECRLMLFNRTSVRAHRLREKTKFLFWLCTDYIRRAPKESKVFVDLSRHATGSILFSCGMQQGTFEHWYLSKAFLCFEAMINWKPRKHSRIVRKLDSDIRVVDESIEGILKLAAIFIELRQTTKARKLIDQALKLNKLPADTEIVCKTYFTAYAMYLNGLIDFEETCPLASKLNAGSRLLDREKLMKAYRSAKKHLRECLKNLTEEISELGLTASAYTLMGIVCVNEAADFTMEHEGGLYYLEKAVSLESKFETNTIMAANMIQILQQGTTLATTQAARDKCRELYFTIVTTREPETIRSQVDVPTDVEASSQSDSVFNVVAKAREFTDGYREGSLAYWKKELNNILDRSQILHRLVFLLFLSRHNLRSYFLRKAECRQAKVSRLISLAFGLKLETNGSFSFKAMSESFPRHCRELIFVVAFWTVNEGMLALGNALEYYQQKSAAEVRQRWDDGDESFASQLVSWALYSFRLSNKKSNDWKRAQECFRRGQDLFNAIRNSWKSDEIPALIFLENYLAEGFYRLNDVVAFDDRYKTDKKLITTTVDLLQDLNRLKRLEKSHNGPGIETLLSYLNSVCVNFPALLNRLLNQSAGRRNRRLHGGLVSSLLESTGILETFDFIIDTSQASDKLKQLDEAYVLCQKRGLMDTVAHALVHMQAGLQLLRYGEVNPFKPHYDSFSAAILKFRKAARILELICGDDVKVTYCYTVLSVLYSSQMQIDEQESRCLQCLRKCARIESNLIVKEASPSPWLWKCLDVARICREQFRMLRQNTNDEDALIEREWQSIFDKLFALLGRKTLMCQMPVDIDDASNSETMLAETLSDALVDWEEKRTVSMKGLTNLFRDRQFPEDCLPSDGEIRVYATYLNKLFSQHWELCHNGDNRDCPLEKLDVVRNHFLLGISEYSRQSVKEKNKIFTRLQQNHNLLLNECKFAKRFHYKFANF